jgi:iron complex outermembrane receptor protein
MRSLAYVLLASASTLTAVPALAQGAPGATPSAASDAAPAAPQTNGDVTPGTTGATTAPSDTIAASQGTAPSPVTQPDAASVGDIVVTAQRRAQNLLSVPLSIQATTGQQLNNTGIRQISQLQFTTPGLTVQSGVGYTQVYIRGVGNNIFVGADPSVATFIDDVPRIYGSSVNNFVNVERVEVLKGAQGGLYGRNATGGVINIITRQPSDKAEAQARVSYGEKHTLRASAYVNVPLTDHIAWNVSVERDSHQGYVKNIAHSNPLTAANFPGGSFLFPVGPGETPAQSAADTAAFFNSAINPQKRYGNQNFWAIDSKLRIKLSDNFKLTLDGDYSKKHDSEGNQWYNPDSASSQAGAEGLFHAFGFPNATFNGLYPQLGKFETLSSSPSHANLVDYGGSAKAELHLEGVDITNIFAYRAQHSLYEQNFAHPVTLDIPIVSNHKWYWYEELRAVSNGSGPIHWLAGATYLRNHFHGETTNLLLPPLNFGDVTHTFTESTDDVRNWSVYGQAGYDFTDKLNLTVSGRYIHETNKAVFFPTTTGLATASLADRTVQAKVHKFLPSATLSYKLGGGGNIYARYAKGFKSGGINPVVPPTLFAGSTTGLVFGPEQVDTYEIGFKNSFFDRKVALTADVFYNNYKGLQTTTVGSAAHPELIEAILNAGTARSYGAEVGVTWKVAKPFTLSVNAGYLNAKYKRFAHTSTGPSDPLSEFNFSHQRMLFSPKWQVGINGDMDVPISDNYRLVGNVLTSYISDVRAGTSTNGLGDPIIKAYWLTNLRLGVRTADDHIGVFAVVTNLFNKGYQTFGSASNFGNSFTWGDPRIISGEVQIKF